MISNASIKTAGYAISTCSVILLGFVSLKTAETDPLLALCLIMGIATSIAGMFLRWLSYIRKEDHADRPSRQPSKST